MMARTPSTKGTTTAACRDRTIIDCVSYDAARALAVSLDLSVHVRPERHEREPRRILIESRDDARVDAAPTSHVPQYAVE